MENRAFWQFEWSAWKLLDCRILHQIPQGFWGSWAAPKPSAVSTNHPLEIPAYGPDIKKIEKIENWTFKKCYHCLKSIKHFSPCKNKFSDARIAIKITFPRLLIQIIKTSVSIPFDIKVSKICSITQINFWYWNGNLWFKSLYLWLNQSLIPIDILALKHHLSISRAQT